MNPYAAFVCSSCGHYIEVGADHAGGTVVCPNCAAQHAVPADERITAKTATAITPRAPVADDDDNEDPYEVEPGDHPDTTADADLPELPSIALAMAEPLRREWEAGLSLQTRLWAFAVYEAGLAFLGATFFFLDGAPPAGLAVSGLIFTALAGFVLGTCDRIDLRRTHRGKVALSKTWRFCFFPLPAQRIKLRQYESLATSADPEHSLPDWIVLIWLLSLGIVPGVLWWIFVFSKPTFQVALTKDHGHPAVILYQGHDEEHSNDMARTICDVCHYRWRKAF